MDGTELAKGSAMRHAVLVASLVASLVAAPFASADQAPQPGMVPLHLSSDTSGAEFEVTVGKRSPVMECTAPCTVWVWPGAYRVRMHGDGIASTTQAVGVAGPTAVEGTAGSSGGRTGGLVLGIAGAGVVLVAFGGMALSGCGAMDCGSHHEESNKTPWLVAMGVGAGVSAIGWILFGANGSSLSAHYAPRVSLAPTREGAALSLSGSF